METKRPFTMKVKELKAELSRLDDEDELYFGSGDLKFNRMKQRGDKLINCEFMQTYRITSDI